MSIKTKKQPRTKRRVTSRAIAGAVRVHMLEMRLFPPFTRDMTGNRAGERTRGKGGVP
jgi:hypothetical protein